MTDELEEACAMLVECIELRKKWLFQVRGRPWPQARGLQVGRQPQGQQLLGKSAATV